MKLAVVDMPDEKAILLLQGQNRSEHRQLIALAKELRKLESKNYVAAVNITRGYAGIAIGL